MTRSGIVATTQFRNRTFDCPTDSTANLAQCDGDNVLAGLNLDGNTNVGAYFGGLLGLVAVLYTLSCFVLWVSLTNDTYCRQKLTDKVYNAGGVRVSGLFIIWT